MLTFRSRFTVCRNTTVVAVPPSGAESQSRIDNRPLTKRVLYQLSYSSIFEFGARGGTRTHTPLRTSASKANTASYYVTLALQSFSGYQPLE